MVQLANPVDGIVATGFTGHAMVLGGHQRKGFRVNSLYWLFYASQSNKVAYKVSSDGQTWGAEVDDSFTETISLGTCIDVFFDGTYVHVAVSRGTSNNLPIYYRRGMPEADGTITWSAAEQIAVAGDASYRWLYPHVMVDQNGYAWIGYCRYSSGVYRPYVTKSGNNDGTWGSTPGGFPYNLIAANYVITIPLCLSDGTMIVVYARGGYTIKAKKYTSVSGWGSEETTATSLYRAYYLSAISVENDVHLVFFTEPYASSIIYVRRDGGTELWDSEVSLASGYQTTASPIIMGDLTTGDIYCFWYDPVTYYIVYKGRVAGEWQDAVIWLYDSLVAESQDLSIYPYSYDDLIGLARGTGDGLGNYNLVFTTCVPAINRYTTPIRDLITLELIRNIETTVLSRFYANEEGYARYESRFARNP